MTLMRRLLYAEQLLGAIEPDALKARLILREIECQLVCEPQAFVLAGGIGRRRLRSGGQQRRSQHERANEE
jgi:hypothetical protein